METENNRQSKKMTKAKLLILLPVMGSLLVTAGMLLSMAGGNPKGVPAAPVQMNVAETFERRLDNALSGMLEDIVPVERIYSLSDSDPVAPKPDPNRCGELSDAAALPELLAQAQKLLGQQQTLLTPQTPIKEGSGISYYLDDTILAMTWKQVVDNGVYTFCEVKIAHPSQFRRFFSNGAYNSGVNMTTTEMAQSVNAVAASSGDYYGYRTFGIVVNNSIVYRERGHLLDTCYIDDQGDLLFTYAGQIVDTEAAEKYVADNHVRFSLCFGPVMIEDGHCKVPREYNSGEINDHYARAALCQLGDLHYLVVTANSEDDYYYTPTVAQFARRLQEMGVTRAYTLDGGQTAAIVLNGKLMNTVSYGSQRQISDIFYFATAIPEKDR